MSERSGWQLASRSVAEAYEHYLMSTFGNAWTQAFIQLAAPAEGDRVLDVACGTGAVARYSAPLVGPTGRVVGLDLNPGMLTIARGMPTLEGIPIEWREGTRLHCPSQMAVLTSCVVSKGCSFSRIRRQLSARCFAS